jgi:hypothetical protein
MIFFSQDSLAKRSKPFRYLHYIVSGVRYVSFATWNANGEPNPFVRPSYRHKGTHRAEFTEIIKDLRGPKTRSQA